MITFKFIYMITFKSIYILLGNKNWILEELTLRNN